MKKLFLILILLALAGCASPFKPVTKIDGGVAAHAGSQAAYDIAVTFTPTNPVRVTAMIPRPYCHAQRMTDNIVCELSYLAANSDWNIRSSCTACEVFVIFKRANGTVVHGKL